MLSAEQIQTLFTFCKKHFVHHYDVQTELVDHLVNAIEDKMAADKNISFETALDSVYAGFGYKGFAEIVQVRASSLRKRYRLMKKEMFRTYFTWPKAAMTFCLYLLLITSFRLLDTDAQAIFICGLLAGIWLFETMLFWQSVHLLRKQTKKLMITEVSPEQNIFNVSFVFQLLIFTRDPLHTIEKTLQQLGFFGYCLLMFGVLIFLIAVIAYRNLVRQIRAAAMKEYPLAFEITS